MIEPSISHLSTGARRVKTSENEERGLIEKIMIFLVTIVFIITFPISVWFCVKSINEYERAVIFRLGKLKQSKPVGPGFVFVLPIIETFAKIDLRTISFDIPTRNVITYDAVSIEVDAVVYYHVFDPIGAVTQIEDYGYAIEKLAQAGLRNTVGKKTLEEFTSQKKQVANSLTTFLDSITDEWGLKIERVEIREVGLPISMKRALAAEAEAAREAKAKIISAEGELSASSVLKQASDVIATNPTALQLRYLQTLTTVSAELNHTILFPLPSEILSLFYIGYHSNMAIS
ncbi:stomatin-like [Condylostylus longicornis]|uniref:stomatin-like n=1 Tax=Condylostylus longicornis TaxID=2530218 RepID=UPI00244DB0E8|nr:stomatin-like [Condylostylus longicornis]